MGQCAVFFHCHCNCTFLRLGVTRVMFPAFDDLIASGGAQRHKTCATNFRGKGTQHTMRTTTYPKWHQVYDISVQLVKKTLWDPVTKGALAQSNCQEHKHPTAKNGQHVYKNAYKKKNKHTFQKNKTCKTHTTKSVNRKWAGECSWDLLEPH